MNENSKIMQIVKSTKKTIKKKSIAKVKPSKGFEKAWQFWKEAQVNLSTFKFDREEANAR